ncbi:hypothetical protein SAMN05216311_107256 [Chitinophaga sp. CF418]|nr:hypothetical protein SAMN05216311_107256 [Chitinophaga sp. CF418]
MEEFFNYILQFGNLNMQQIDLITSKAKKLELHKEEYFSEAGKIPRYVGFILKGVVRFCYYNNKAKRSLIHSLTRIILFQTSKGLRRRLWPLSTYRPLLIVNFLFSPKKTGTRLEILLWDGML